MERTQQERVKSLANSLSTQRNAAMDQMAQMQVAIDDRDAEIAFKKMELKAKDAEIKELKKKPKRKAKK